MNNDNTFIGYKESFLTHRMLGLILTKIGQLVCLMQMVILTEKYTTMALERSEAFIKCMN